jgi:hypothetical protein
MLNITFKDISRFLTRGYARLRERANIEGLLQSEPDADACSASRLINFCAM